MGYLVTNSTPNILNLPNAYCTIATAARAHEVEVNPKESSYTAPLNTVLFRLIYFFQTTATCSRLLHLFDLRDEDTNKAFCQHAIPVDPRMYLHEQLGRISASTFHQLSLAPRMEWQIRCDVVDLSLIFCPCISPFPPIVILQHRRWNPDEVVWHILAAQLVVRIRRHGRPVEWRVSWCKYDFA